MLTVKVGISAIYLHAVLGRSVAQASICEERKAPSEGRVQPSNTVPFQPCILKNIILISDYMWHPEPTHTHSRTVGCELWMVRLQEQLLKIILFTCSTGVGSAFTSWSKPQEPQMEEMCSLIFYYITVARFLPQLRFTQMSLSPSWLPVSHYHRDNHPVHNTQDAVCR